MSILRLRYMAVIPLALMLFNACKVQHAVRFAAGELEYLLDVPAHYKVKEVVDYHGYTERRFIYRDSSIIYITNDNHSGGSINTQKAAEYGEDIYLKILSSDTLSINGQKDGKYWKEEKRGDVVVGYLRVPLEKKQEYDRVLSSLKRTGKEL